MTNPWPTRCRCYYDYSAMIMATSTISWKNVDKLVIVYFPNLIYLNLY